MIRIREYQNLSAILADNAVLLDECRQFALRNQTDENGDHRPLLKIGKGGVIKPQNYVGLLRLKSGDIEIYPKIRLTQNSEENGEQERGIFYTMLREWRGLKWPPAPDADIAALQKFPMLEAFQFLFLHQTLHLVKRGIVHHYHATTDNLPHLKGRLLFPQQAIINSANMARFFVEYDQYSPNTAANRLIRATLGALRCRQQANERMRRQLSAHFHAIPASTNQQHDWQTHQRHTNNRAMQHYAAVMQWIGLFLFGHGLAAYHGDHHNKSLLFPMQQVFEDFVAAAFRQHASDKYAVTTQSPQFPLATGDSDKKGIFALKPDIVLTPKSGDTRIILDAKWKPVDETNRADKFGISQADLYQLFAYGKIYNCQKVALIYPQRDKFRKAKTFTYNDPGKLQITCHPFNLRSPQKSVAGILA